MKSFLCAASAVLFVAAAAPASAAIVLAQGTFTPSNPGTMETVAGFSVPFQDVIRDYEFTITFDRPVIIETNGVLKAVFNDYDGQGHYLGGNDYTSFPHATSDVRSNSLTWTEHLYYGPESRDNGVTRNWVTFYDGTIFAQADDEGAIAYSLTMTAVPEPATWALMIVGFGLAGASVRARRPDAARII